MIIECTSCRSKYQYDEARFEQKPSKKIRCARCQQVFEIFNPAFASAAASTPAGHSGPAESRPAADSRKEVGEETSIRRERLKTVSEEPIPDLAAAAPPPEAIGPRMPTGKRLSLAIIDGPDAGSVYRMEKPRITIGRQGADLTLNDSDASRQHAVVEIRDTNYAVTDLGSTNGTLVNGQKIEGTYELQNQSEFQIGSSILMLIVTDET